MTTIQIAYDIPEATVSTIEAHLAAQAARNSDWNGVDFHIERADYTCIPGSDADHAVALLHQINAIIRGECDE